MFLGIDIGGTKLQLGVGRGDGTLAALERYDVNPAHGARGILRQIETAGRVLAARHAVSAVGFGFGGPIDRRSGIVVKSHHVSGWDNFPLVDWCRRELLLPAALENDCDAACLAEGLHGAGQGYDVVFYVTVGTGIGGGLVVDGQIFRGSGHGVAEIGHMRPGLHADRPDQTIESLASGWGIAAAAQARLTDPISHAFVPFTSGLRGAKPGDVRQRLIETEEAEAEYAADLFERAGGKLERLTAQIVSQAAGEGNEIAREVLAHACQALGWAIAQVVTLVAPQIVVIGGGVASMDESLFLAPLRAEVNRYVFEPLLGTFQLLPAALGEPVVVLGAICAAADKSSAGAP
jgi:glucokinase